LRDENSARRRAIAVVVLLLIIFLAWWFMRGGPAPAPPPAPSPSPTAQPSPTPLVAEPMNPMATPPPVKVVRKRLIERIWSEPRTACRGETALIRVDLAEGHEDAKVFINGTPGRTVGVVFDETGSETVRVSARDWYDGIQFRKFRLTVRDCGLSDRLRIENRPVQGVGEARFFRVLNPSDEGGYRWDFGDGSRGRSEGPLIEHSYRLRPQEEATSAFVVRVVSEGDGREGVATLSLTNPLFVASRGPVLWLGVEADPMVPPAPPGQPREIRATVASSGASSIRLHGVGVRGFLCRDTNEQRITTLGDEALSQTLLPAGSITELVVRLPPDAFAEPICRGEIRLLGTTPRGRPVQSAFPIELDLPDDARPERNINMLRRLQCARMILGRDRINQQDLDRLAASGAFAEAGCTP
jgi:hypothetical protein